MHANQVGLGDGDGDGGGQTCFPGSSSSLFSHAACKQEGEEVLLLVRKRRGSQLF